MISRTALLVALIVSLSVLGTVAFADAPPDTGGNGGGDPGGNGGTKPQDEKKDDKETDDEETDDKGGSMFGAYFLPMMIGLIVLMLFMSGRGKRKQQAKHDQLLGGLKKGDKVRTIGGILGSVVEVRDDEVVLRIDDNANTRMRVIRKAISGMVVDGKKDEEQGR